MADEKEKKDLEKQDFVQPAFDFPDDDIPPEFDEQVDLDERPDKFLDDYLQDEKRLEELRELKTFIDDNRAFKEVTPEEPPKTRSLDHLLDDEEMDEVEPVKEPEHKEPVKKSEPSKKGSHALLHREMYVETAFVNVVRPEKKETIDGVEKVTQKEKRNVRFKSRVRGDVDQSAKGMHADRDLTKGKGMTGVKRQNAQERWMEVTLDDYKRIMEGAGNKVDVDYKTPIDPKKGLQIVGKDTPNEDVPVFKGAVQGFVMLGDKKMRKARQGEKGHITALAKNELQPSEAPPFDRQANIKGISEANKNRAERAKKASQKSKDKEKDEL